MTKIRVGFLLGNVGWLGGVNYFRNLLTAVHAVSAKDIEIVVFTGLYSDVKAFESIAQIVRTPILDRKSPQWWISKFMSRIFPKRDYVLYKKLKEYKIDVLSHASPLWPNSGIKTVTWIPDFQHLHLPEFFDKKECRSRDAAFMAMARNSDCVILSSETAQRDLIAFAPVAAARSEVLRFVPEINLAQNILSSEQLSRKYGFSEKYFYMPNQFWKHKNHRVVIEALILLKKSCHNFTLLTTGANEDVRNPGHFKEIMSLVKANGLDSNFKMLGVIPYADLLSLMHNSVSVVNPSLFEGWSSTVEEAKALGKKILISDIPVHREQNPELGIFFDPLNAHDLAEKMIQVMHADNSTKISDIEHTPSYPIMRKKFGEKYAEIIRQVHFHEKI